MIKTQKDEGNIDCGGCKRLALKVDKLNDVVETQRGQIKTLTDVVETQRDQIKSLTDMADTERGQNKILSSRVAKLESDKKNLEYEKSVLNDQFNGLAEENDGFEENANIVLCRQILDEFTQGFLKTWDRRIKSFRGAHAWFVENENDTDEKMKVNKIRAIIQQQFGTELTTRKILFQLSQIEEALATQRNVIAHPPFEKKNFEMARETMKKEQFLVSEADFKYWDSILACMSNKTT